MSILKPNFLHTTMYQESGKAVDDFVYTLKDKAHLQKAENLLGSWNRMINLLKNQ